ncbi:cupin domain-containing protein [Deinococcus yavapaiensis]|uniref:Quercetin dioxygenase-like cupin family protein n=1 Tax=Deinococcus yavapaiensis KR-236 TaxID=694435 RepID=A0A318SAK3_9DEIO|nr:cupin domain-containing protein [Deinococcus yavapaiensis]PYE55438.1 quercetin dioxygenase-like cupin family protein [Deinococcus yavapaiensis KR-236]
MIRVQAGDRLDNPVTGERGVVIEAPSDTNGRRLIVEILVRPGGAVAGAHVHPAIDETFTVLRGHVGMLIGDKKMVAPLGEAVHCPAGTVHDWWNAGDEDAVIRAEITPGDRFLEMVINLFSLAQDGKTNKKGMPNLLQLVVFGEEFQDVVSFVGGPPKPVLKLMGAVLGPIARSLGYKGSYPEYVERIRRTPPISAHD